MQEGWLSLSILSCGYSLMLLHSLLLHSLLLHTLLLHPLRLHTHQRSKIKGEGCLIHNFNMLKSKHDRTRLSSILLGMEVLRWIGLEEKWSLMNTWELGQWWDECGFSYLCLCFVQISSRLDQICFSYNVY